MTREADRSREGDWSVCRNLLLDKPPNPHGVDRVSALLTRIPGVIDVRVRAGQRRVTVCYNLTRCQYGVLARLLSESGFAVDRSLPQRVKAAIYRLLDDNGRANARLPQGSCCNRPPRGRH